MIYLWFIGFNMKSSKGKKRFSVGLSTKSYLWLKAQAEHEGRSLSGMVNKIIQQTITEEEEKADLKPVS